MTVRLDYRPREFLMCKNGGSELSPYPFLLVVIQSRVIRVLFFFLGLR